MIKCLTGCATAVLMLGASVAAPVYSSGSINGTISASTFGREFEVTTPFSLSGDVAAAAATIGLWSAVGLSPLSIAWRVGTSAFGGELGSGSSQVSATLLRPMSFGGGDFWLYEAVFDLGQVNLGRGSYFLTLTDATLNGDGYLMWDITAAQYVGAAQRGAGGWYSNIYSPSLELNEASTSIPEPASLALVVAGLLVALGFRWRGTPTCMSTEA